MQRGRPVLYVGQAGLSRVAPDTQNPLAASGWRLSVKSSETTASQLRSASASRRAQRHEWIPAPPAGQAVEQQAKLR